MEIHLKSKESGSKSWTEKSVTERQTNKQIHKKETPDNLL